MGTQLGGTNFYAFAVFRGRHAHGFAEVPQERGLVGEPAVEGDGQDFFVLTAGVTHQQFGWPSHGRF